MDTAKSARNVYSIDQILGTGRPSRNGEKTIFVGRTFFSIRRNIKIGSRWKFVGVYRYEVLLQLHVDKVARRVWAEVNFILR